MFYTQSLRTHRLEVVPAVVQLDEERVHVPRANRALRKQGSRLEGNRKSEALNQCTSDTSLTLRGYPS